jgi:hypothetical protein|uniref:Uncharacterized protein n=2 Tax=Picea TaxID=3328 RepID=A0A124GMY5_PICGL|nr:hypothetical protein ABT39_MTgene6128 [Picea glauca]QHR92767.1 hypothetical protein Q903MT_gene6815 [Picea sitchensis]
MRVRFNQLVLKRVLHRMVENSEKSRNLDFMEALSISLALELEGILGVHQMEGTPTRMRPMLPAMGL